MIDEIVAIHVRVPLTRVFRISVGSSTHSETVIIGVKSGEVRGFGEAPPSVRLAGESIGTVLDTLNLIHERILKAETKGEIYEVLQRIHGGPALKAGLEGALRDLTAKKGRLSPRDLWCTRAGVYTDMTVSLDEPERQAKEAEEFVKMGFKALKVKLDGNEEKNVERIKAIREAVGDIPIRVDFNTALKPHRAYKHMRELERFDIELFEQPVRNVRSLLPNKLDTPIFADESAYSVSEAVRLIEDGIDGIVLKLAKHGLEGARFLLDFAKRSGAMILVGCTSETGVGASFLTALAASGADFVDVDSDVHLMYKIDDRTAPKEGYRSVPDEGFTAIRTPDDVPKEVVINKRRRSL